MIITVIYAYLAISGKAGTGVLIVLILSWVAYFIMHLFSRRMLKELNDMKDEEIDEFFGKKDVSSYAKMNVDDENLRTENDETHDDSEINEVEKEKGKGAKPSWDEILYESNDSVGGKD
jgi:hypothetical protein